MLREAGVEGAVPMDGLPSSNFPGTFYHPRGHVWDWTKDEMVDGTIEEEAASPGGTSDFPYLRYATYSPLRLAINIWLVMWVASHVHAGLSSQIFPHAIYILTQRRPC